jgi:hypothetical protein
MERICMTVLQLANGDDETADEAAAPFETPPFEFDFEFEFCFVDNGDDNDDIFPHILMFVLLLSSSDL